MRQRPWVFGSRRSPTNPSAAADGELRRALRLYEIVVDVQATDDDLVLETKLAALLSEPAYRRDRLRHGGQAMGRSPFELELVTVRGHARPIYAPSRAAALVRDADARSRVSWNLTCRRSSPVSSTGWDCSSTTTTGPGSTYPKRASTSCSTKRPTTRSSRGCSRTKGIALHFDPRAQREVIVLSDSNSGMRRPSHSAREYRDSAFEEEAVFGVTHKRQDGAA